MHFIHPPPSKIRHKRVIAKYLRNCYIIPSSMFVIGGFEISSLEGIQGDPTSMEIYAVTIIPFVLMKTQVVSLTLENTSHMVAYGDDYTAGGKTKDFNHWWKTLRELGLKFGYYPEASKS